MSDLTKEISDKKKKYGNLPKRFAEAHLANRKYFDSADNNAIDSKGKISVDKNIISPPVASTTLLDLPLTSKDTFESLVSSQSPPTSIIEHAHPLHTILSIDSPSPSSLYASPIVTRTTPLQSHNLKLLIVDNVEASSRMLKVALTRAKFVVDVVPNAQEMWIKLNTINGFINPYRVILFNIQDIHAMDIIRQIRASETEKSLLFGMGPNNKATREQFDPWIDAGMDGYIYSGSIIAKEVQTFISKKDKDPNTFLMSL